MYLDKKNLYLLLICGLFGTAPLWAVELKEAEITALKNIVEHDTGEGKGAAPAHASEKIYEKSKVSTAAASMAELTFADTSITRVGSNTSFSFQSKERLVKLDKGTILINTPPGAGGATVDCGGVTAAVTGTTFMASVDGNGNKMFVLLEGAGGMKVTAGGKTTIVRAGQAASVGGGEGGGKKEDSSGGPGEKKAGGDKPSADTKESGGSKEPGGDSAGAGDGGKPKAAAPTPAADKGPGEGSAGGGKPPAAPTIQVFDVDVQKVVASTPLIQAFEKPLPSAQKIQATVDVQQAKMSEGKMESLGVEIVAVKADGDVLVGTPKVVAEAPPKKEEPKADAPAKKEDVVAKKEEVAGKKEDVGMKPEPKADPKMAGGPAPDNLDISTAAGPGAGAPPAPSGTSVAAAIPPPPPAAPSIQPPPVNIGQIVNQRPQELAPIVLTVRANDASRAFGAPNPDFGFSITAGGLLAGHSVVTDLRTTANNFSEVSGGPFGITLEGLRILDGSGGNVTSRYNLTKVSGSLTIFQAEQSVNFALPSNLTFGTEAGLVAGVRGGEVSFEVLSGPAEIVGGKLVARSGTGSVVVKAVTAGDGNYLGAEAQQTINLAKAGQSVSFTLPGSLTFGTDTSLSATKLDSAVVSFEVLSGPAKIENGKLVPDSGTGTVVVKAVTPGDANYRGAEAQQTITLSKAAQMLTIDRPALALTGGAFTLAASGSMTGPVDFSILEKDGRANVRPDGVVTLGKILGADTLTIRAEAAGSTNYLSGRTDLTVALGRDEVAIAAADPTKRLLSSLGEPKLVEALAKFFYFTGKAAGVEGPSRFFSDVSGSTRSLSDYSDRSVALYDGRPGEFYAMGTLNGAGPTHDITLGSADTVIFANRINLGQAGLGPRELSKVADGVIPDFNAVGYTSELSAGDLAFKADGTAATSALPFYVLSASLAIKPADAFGMFAGDYKAYLTYMDSAGAGQTINLLDRIGTSASDREGSAANEITATFSDYATDQAINSATGDPIAGTFQPGYGNIRLQGTMGAILPAGKFFMTVGDLSEGGLGVLDNWSVSLVQRVKMSVLGGAGKNLSLISGLAGTAIDGTLWDVGQANLKFMSAGEFKLNDSEFYNLGSQLSLESAQDLSIKGIAARGEALGGTDVNLSTGGSLTLKNSKLLVNGALTATAAVGPVKLDAEAGDVLIQAARDVVISGADLIETSAGGAGVTPEPSSLAVVRTGDSLEMRNVVIRGFSEVRLEKGSELNAPRVLVSGSTVRDFKIKELVGPLINADSKIQMAALDASGELAGEMKVYNRLPVKQMMAGVLDNNLPNELKTIQVDAQTISLAAKRLEFQNTTMAAMSAITARANTVLLNNANFTVIAQNGMINFYTRLGEVNRTYGSEVGIDNGKLNFSGVNNFRIGTTTFTVQDQATLNQHYGNSILDMNQNFGRPEAGKVNVLKM